MKIYIIQSRVRQENSKGHHRWRPWGFHDGTILVKRIGAHRLCARLNKGASQDWQFRVTGWSKSQRA